MNRRRDVELAWAALVLVGGLVSCTEAPAEPKSSPEPPPVNVSIATLEPASLRDRIRLAGRLEPWMEVAVASELGGTVQDIGFEKGEFVQRGEVLARIGTDLLEAALAEAEAELGAAEAEYTKTTRLFERRAVPRQDLVAATAQYERAKARVRGAKLRVGRSIIEAPLSGVAIDRFIERGEVVPAGARVTTLHQLSRLKASVGIPENDISFFEVGSEALLEVDAFPGRDFEGRIHFVGPAATGQNRTFPAEIAVDNAKGDLRPGMVVRVLLVKRVYQDAVVIPRDAVLERDTGTVAFVYQDGRAELRQVTTGPSEGDRIVVLDGLSPGEALVVKGHRNLVDGQRVRPVDGAHEVSAGRSES